MVCAHRGKRARACDQRGRGEGDLTAARPRRCGDGCGRSEMEEKIGFRVRFKLILEFYRRRIIMGMAIGFG